MNVTRKNICIDKDTQAMLDILRDTLGVSDSAAIRVGVRLYAAKVGKAGLPSRTSPRSGPKRGAKKPKRKTAKKAAKKSTRKAAKKAAKKIARKAVRRVEKKRPAARVAKKPRQVKPTVVNAPPSES